MWRQNCEVGFQMVPNPLFLPLHGIIRLRGSPRDLWVKPLAFRWAKNSLYQAYLLWSSGTDNSIICSGGIVEDSCDFLYCYKISLLPSVSFILFGHLCTRRKISQLCTSAWYKVLHIILGKRSDYSKLTVLFNLTALFYNFSKYLLFLGILFSLLNHSSFSVFITFVLLTIWDISLHALSFSRCCVYSFILPSFRTSNALSTWKGLSLGEWKIQSLLFSARFLNGNAKGNFEN